MTGKPQLYFLIGLHSRNDNCLCQKRHFLHSLVDNLNPPAVKEICNNTKEQLFSRTV